jgi:hypothetical protein
VTTPPTDLPEGAFWLKKGTFKTVPRDHALCFTCHSVDGGIEPMPSNCAACHKLPPPGLDASLTRAHDGFDPQPPPAPAMDPVPTGMCAEHPLLPEAILPRCSKATHECVLACGGDDPDGDDDAAEACRNACLAADVTPPELGVDCKTCTVAQLFGCLGAEGCELESDRFACCAADCGSDAECLQNDCAGELQAFALCAYYVAPECLTFIEGPIAACFAAD